jgi:hypothetical protein
MVMDNKTEWDKFLERKLSPDELEIGDPELSLVREARNKVLLRKKPVQQKPFALLNWLRESRPVIMQLGASMAMIIGCFVYASTDTPDKGYVSAQEGTSQGQGKITTTLTTIQTCVKH